MSMKCLACDERTLQGRITIQKDVPLGKKNGTLVFPPGSNITVADQKSLWDDQEIRGPITCTSCGQEHFYIKGPGLIQGSYEEALDAGSEAFLD